MQIMESRQQQLEAALAGLTATGKPLVAKVGGALIPAGQTDDVGTYYYIPALARWLNMDLNSAIHLFYYGLCFGAAVLAFMCFFSWLDNTPRRLVAAVASAYLIALFFGKARGFGDIYLLNISAPLMLMPIVAWGLRPAAVEGRGMTAIVVVVGALVSLFEFARSHSAAPVMVFTVAALVLNFDVPWRRRLRDLAVFLLVIWVGMQASTSLVAQRDRYLASVDPRYQPVLAVHPLWHSVYIGLAFLPNPHGVNEYSDTVASDFVQSVNPKAPYLSWRYEKILRQEVTRIAKADPWFVIRTGWGKLVKIADDSRSSLILFAIGLIAGFRDRARRGLDVGLVLALGVAMMPGLLVWPATVYYLGVHAVCLVALLLGGIRLLHAGPPWGDELLALAQRFGSRFRGAANPVTP